MMTRIAILAAALLASTAIAGLERVGSASASFVGKGPAGFKLEGKTSDLSLEEGSGGVIRISVALANLDTGIELRNRHMRDKYLEVQKFPSAVLELKRSDISFPADGQSAQAKATGKMMLHGRTRDVGFTYSIKNSGGVYAVTGDLPLNIKDFDIHIPSYMGITVKPDIQTQVSFSFKE